MNRWMLDTNTVSYFVKRHPAVTAHVTRAPMASLCISAITEAELLFGLARRPEAKRLHFAVQQFLRRVEVIAWGRPAAARYGTIRAELQPLGTVLAPIDLLIAAHAMAEQAILVTSDRAFQRVKGLELADWTLFPDKLPFLS